MVPPKQLLQRISSAVGYTPIANIVGSPAMSVPLHFPEDGIPIGSHFAAAPGADALLLGLAYELELARPWKDMWPPYSIPKLFG
jgi:amidase